MAKSGLKKESLRPGMWVRNTRSGNTGQILGREDAKWSTADGYLTGADWCVMVRTRTKIGKHKGRYEYTYWNVENLQLANL